MYSCIFFSMFIYLCSQNACVLSFCSFINQTCIRTSCIKCTAFNSTSICFDDLLNSDSPYFEKMVTHIYPTKLQLNKANSTYTKAPLLNLHLSISKFQTVLFHPKFITNAMILILTLIANFPPLLLVFYISQLIWLAKVSCL